MNETVQVHRLTAQVQSVIKRARQEAEQLGHNYVGTEHLLLGLLDEKESKAARVLALLYVDEQALREHLQEMLKMQKRQRQITFVLGRLGALTISYDRDARRLSHVVKNGRPLTRRARKSIHLAIEEAIRMHSEQVDTHHLLLGIVREGGGLACILLERAGIRLDEIERCIPVS